jgi:hypothetical protein
MHRQSKHDDANQLSVLTFNGLASDPEPIIVPSTSSTFDALVLTSSCGGKVPNWISLKGRCFTFSKYKSDLNFVPMIK